MTPVIDSDQANAFNDAVAAGEKKADKPLLPWPKVKAGDDVTVVDRFSVVVKSGEDMVAILQSTILSNALFRTLGGIVNSGSGKKK